MIERANASFLTRRQQEIVLRSLSKLLVDKYVFAEKGAQAANAILSHMERGDYNLSPEQFAEAVTQDLQFISSDHHLRLVCDAVRIAGMAPGSGQKNDRSVLEIARRNHHGFERIERLKGNIGYVDIRHFFPPSVSEDVATAAMRLIADSDAIIIDLRNNTGGNPSMVQLLCSYFFGGDNPVHLNTIVSQSPSTQTEYWTLCDLPGKRMPDIDLTILISCHTFSGGEEFAYNMKHLGRATLIGETTAGGANPAGIHIINESFYATIPHARPVNPITRGNWEGCGVDPHIQVPASQALEIAHSRALGRLIDTATDELSKKKLQWVFEEVKSGFDPVDLPAFLLERYVGSYGDSKVLLESNRLIYYRRFFRYQLRPLSETLFWLDGPSAGFESRVEFAEDESGAITHLTGLFPDGRAIMHPRQFAAP